ncbi:MAG TPA: GntR family transcriptional regulator [Gammaproteobacteria bacterium]|nr:GntR family transcriptional regulator [Gammaproteobacteria bacterium]
MAQDGSAASKTRYAHLQDYLESIFVARRAARRAGRAVPGDADSGDDAPVRIGEGAFRVLLREILDGTYPPGSAIPPERTLAEHLGSNRGAVREAIKRLQQAGVVVSRQGHGTRVLDYRQSGSMNLLDELLRSRDGRINTDVARNIIDLRLALGTDAAGLAALRATPAQADELESRALALPAREDDLEALEGAVAAFWMRVLDLSGNLLYRLVFNAMRDGYDRYLGLLRPLLAEEYRAFDEYRAIAAAVRRGNAQAARERAGVVLGLGAHVMCYVMDWVDERRRQAGD